MTTQYTPPTPLQSCRAMLARVDAAHDRNAVAAAYADFVGFDPFADAPEISTAEARLVLVDFVRDAADVMGVHWSLVVSA